MLTFSKSASGCLKTCKSIIALSFHVFFIGLYSNMNCLQAFNDRACGCSSIIVQFYIIDTMYRMTNIIYMTGILVA